jgi:fructose-1,6-bisphosphatase/inositol monophosphatase family enzyme
MAVFVCHGHDFENLARLETAFEKSGIRLRYSAGFVEGLSIENQIVDAVSDSLFGIYILTKKSSLSAWCHFELALLQSQGKDIFVWDVDNMGREALPSFLPLGRLLNHSPQGILEALREHASAPLSWVRIPGSLDVRVPERLRNMWTEHAYLETATRSVAGVSSIISKIYDIVNKYVPVRDPDDVVTHADEEAHRHLESTLDDSKIGLVSEESVKVRDRGRVADLVLRKLPCWIVDPLDATTAFRHRAGRHLPSVMVALVEAGPGRGKKKNISISLAIIHFPCTMEWYFAVRGRGSYKNNARLGVLDGALDLKESWISFNQYANQMYETDRFRRILTGVRAAGAPLVTVDPPHSGVAMRVIDGDFGVSAAVHDNNAKKPKQCIWDVTACKLIVEEAGGQFLNSRGLPYDILGTPDLVVVAQTQAQAQKILATAKTA